MANRVSLPARMDLSAAQTLVQQLSERDFSSEIILDATAVDHLGALCAQAIIAAARKAQTDGGSVAMLHVSERVETQLGAMGLSSTMLMEGAQ